MLEDRKQRAQVCGLKEELVSSVEDVFRLVMKGSHERTSGTTSANNQSSRSHAIFQIILKKRLVVLNSICHTILSMSVLL